MNAKQIPRDIIVVGASAGGVEALTNFFRNLPADLAAAVLAVLHIRPETPSQLATVLARITHLPVKPALTEKKLWLIRWM